MTATLTIKKAITSEKVVVSYEYVDIKVGAEYMNDWDTDEIFTVLVNDSENAVLFNSETDEKIVVKNDRDSVNEFLDDYSLV